MRKIVLDGTYLLDRETVHEYLKETLELPEYYGKNLDALYDCLTDLEATVIEIKIPEEQIEDEEKNRYFKRVLRVFKMAARENENLSVI